MRLLPTLLLLTWSLGLEHGSSFLTQELLQFHRLRWQLYRDPVPLAVAICKPQAGLCQKRLHWREGEHFVSVCRSPQRVRLMQPIRWYRLSLECGRWRIAHTLIKR